VVLWEFAADGIHISSDDEVIKLAIHLGCDLFSEYTIQESLQMTIDTAELLLCTKNLRRNVPVCLFIPQNGNSLGLLITQNQQHIRTSIIYTYKTEKKSDRVPMAGYVVYNGGTVEHTEGVPIDPMALVQMLKEYASVSKHVVLCGNHTYLEWSTDETKSLNKTDNRCTFFWSYSRAAMARFFRVQEHG
jgi:putative AlgH/UPF0301 family transcriptional regulator